MTAPQIPTVDAYMRPIIEALGGLGGSATNAELDERVADAMKLKAEQLAVVHDPEKSTQTEVAYRMAWSRTHLKNFGCEK